MRRTWPVLGRSVTGKKSEIAPPGGRGGVAAALGGRVEWGTVKCSVKWKENEHNLN